MPKRVGLNEIFRFQESIKWRGTKNTKGFRKKFFGGSFFLLTFAALIGMPFARDSERYSYP